MQMTNAYATGCWQCGHPVAAGEGLLEPAPMGWKVRCMTCVHPKATCGECGQSKARHLVPDGVCVDCR